MPVVYLAAVVVCLDPKDMTVYAESASASETCVACWMCVGQHPLPLCTEMQADMLAKLKDDAGVIKLLERGTLNDCLPYLISRPFASILAIHDSADLILKVIGRAALIIERLAKRKPPILHRDISVGNLVYCGEDQEIFLIDFGAAMDANVARACRALHALAPI